MTMKFGAFQDRKHLRLLRKCFIVFSLRLRNQIDSSAEKTIFSPYSIANSKVTKIANYILSNRASETCTAGKIYWTL